MELRSLEEKVNAMAWTYHCLRRRHVSSADGEVVQNLPPILVDNIPMKDENQETVEAEDSLAQVLLTLESFRDVVAELNPKMDRYRKRLLEKDPVTGAPRYGDTTMARVTAMLATFDALSDAIRVAFGEEGNDNTANSVQLIEEIRLVVQRQEEKALKENLELTERVAREEAQRKAQEDQRLEQERRAEEAALLSQRREQEELSQRAQEARRARQEAEQARLEREERAREEAGRQDRQWVSSVAKGPDGVRRYLETLRHKTGASDYKLALNALHTLFSQIVSHPEEVKFRRVRRDHPKFQEDIGRHEGGREILIAAGFRLGAIDDVPCFISTEPNIEKDMDGWSQWFDLLKATLEILEEELVKS